MRFRLIVVVLVFSVSSAGCWNQFRGDEIAGQAMVGPDVNNYPSADEWAR